MTGTADGQATTAPVGPSRRPPAVVPRGRRSRPRAGGRRSRSCSGSGVMVLSSAVLSTVFSVGGSLLIWLVGIPIVALGLEVGVRFARLERWRMTLVDPRPLVPHPYRPLNGMPEAPYGPWLRDLGRGRVPRREPMARHRLLPGPHPARAHRVRRLVRPVGDGGRAPPGVDRRSRSSGRPHVWPLRASCSPSSSASCSCRSRPRCRAG